MLQRGYKYEELYNMTVKELKNSLEQVNKGLAYYMFRDKILLNHALRGKMKKTPEEEMPELYPPKKTYQMPEWVRKRYEKQKKGGC